MQSPAKTNRPLQATWILLAALLATLLWSYWPTLSGLRTAWNNEPDYSHGYFVVPLALWFLWARRDQFPAGGVRPALFAGMVLILLAGILRIQGALFFLGAVDGWSMLVWLCGAVLLFAGWKVLWWCLPSIAFLWFMIPMPYTLERMFRLPLQAVATQISTTALLILGQPAIAEGNTIRIGEATFGIAEACSGLRIFVGVAALAFAFVILSHRSWLVKGLLIASVLPVTLIANSTRIVATCLLQLNVSSEISKKFSHDISGFVMIPFAAVLLGLVLWYAGLVFREVQVASVKDIVRPNLGT